MLCVKRLCVLTLGLLMLLCACTPGTSEKKAEAAPTAAPLQTLSPDSDGSPEESAPATVTINGETFAYDGFRVLEPECDLDIYSMEPKDFTDDFNTVYECQRESYQLTPETETETTVVRITGQEPGPTVYIAAGIHGDERAAWFAGLMLQKITIRAGTLYVLSPANAKGAKVVSRMVGEEDPNRCFPGQEDGTEAQRLCYAIFHDIEEKAPEQLLDLHEAIVYKEGRDFLGSTLIYSSLDGMQDMFFDLLFATQAGEVTSTSFGYNGPGPAGSMNRTVTDQLHIPSITVETFRGFPIERRVKDQLKVAAYVLRYKGML